MKADEVRSLAVAIFEDEDKAKLWLSTFNLALGGTPESMLKIEHGADEVSKVLNSIAHGGVV